MKFEAEIVKYRDMNEIGWRWEVHAVGTAGLHQRQGSTGTKWGAKRQIKKAIKTIKSELVPFKEIWEIEV